MCFDMIDGDKGQAPRPRQGFGGIEACQQRPRQARTIGGSDGIDVAPATGGLGDDVADDLLDTQNMLARCDLGYDTSITAMNVDLRSHHVGDYRMPIAYDCGSGFVARGFDCEYGLEGFYHQEFICRYGESIIN
jgi:hypothetical protein